MKHTGLELVTDSAPEILEGVVFDGGTLGKVEITDAGFVKAPASITRTGVFVYRNPDGSLRRELRLPEEVFAADSLATLGMVPLTREHPEPLGTPVTTANRKMLDVGVVGNDVRREGDHVVATVQVEDAAAIADISSGRRRELSAGYNRKLELSPGVWNGLRYDGIQRAIRYNHVALTASGRAGPDVRLRLDSNAAVMVCDARDVADQPQEPRMKRKIKIDGITYELDCEDSTIEALTKAITERDTRLAAVDSQVAEAKKAADGHKARADSAEAELKKAEKLVADSTAPGKVAELVKARLELERVAKPLLVDAKGKEPELADVADDEIKRRVVLVHDSDAKLESASAEYLEGRYAGAVKALSSARSSKAAAGNAALRAVTNPAPGAATVAAAAVTVDADDSRAKLRKESEEAWQRPLGPQPASGAQ